MARRWSLRMLRIWREQLLSPQARANSGATSHRARFVFASAPALLDLDPKMHAPAPAPAPATRVAILKPMTSAHARAYWCSNSNHLLLALP